MSNTIDKNMNQSHLSEQLISFITNVWEMYGYLTGQQMEESGLNCGQINILCLWATHSMPIARSIHLLLTSFSCFVLQFTYHIFFNRDLWPKC